MSIESDLALERDEAESDAALESIDLYCPSAPCGEMWVSSRHRSGRRGIVIDEGACPVCDTEGVPV